MFKPAHLQSKHSATFKIWSFAFYFLFLLAFIIWNKFMGHNFHEIPSKVEQKNKRMCPDSYSQDILAILGHFKLLILSQRSCWD